MPGASFANLDFLCAIFGLRVYCRGNGDKLINYILCFVYFIILINRVAVIVIKSNFTAKEFFRRVLHVSNNYDRHDDSLN